MVLSRPAIRCFKAPSRLPFHRSKASLRPSIWQRSSRRQYSSSAGGDDHGAHKKASELPWLIGSLAVFLPSAYYLALPQLNKKPHGEGHGHDSHASGDDHSDDSKEDSGDAESSEGGDEKSGEEQKEEGGEEKSEGGDDEAKPDNANEAEEKGDATSKDSDDTEKEGGDEEAKESTSEKPEKQNREFNVTKEKGKSEVPGVQFKGKTLAGEDGQQTHTEKHVPDAKGFNKKRLESHYGKILGQAEDEEQSADGKDLGAASKTPGDFNTISGKQEGLANTDTKHSTDITKNPDKSKKGDGSAETSKQKGTVDLNRKLV